MLSSREFKDELIWHIRNSNIRPTDRNNRRGMIAKIKNGGIFFGSYASKNVTVNYQKSIAKISYVANTSSSKWASHGHYLQREIDGKRGLGFDRTKEEVDIPTLLKEWQKARDPRLFKIIISPEQGDRLDLKKHTRMLMEKFEQDYGTRFEWAAVHHTNTDSPHIHVVLRGVDSRGKEIRINRMYISNGLRQRSMEIATRQIGPRLIRDIVKRRQMAIEKNYITELDRDIWKMKDVNNIITFNRNLPKSAFEVEKRLHVIGRLQYLSSLGFAEKTGVISWKVKPDLLEALTAYQKSHDIIKRRAHHQASITDQTLPLKRTVLRDGESVVGRIVGFGLDNDHTGYRYLLLEGVDGYVHYIHPNMNMVRARDTWRIKNSDIVYLQGKKSFKNNKSIDGIQFINWGTLDTMKWSKNITFADRYFLKNYFGKKQSREISPDIRTFRRNFFNMMNDRIYNFQTLGRIDASLRIKKIKHVRE